MKTSKRKSLTWLLSVLALVAVVAPACGSDNNSSKAATGSRSSTTVAAEKPTCAPGTLAAAGSTFVKNIAQQWIADYQTACSGSTINYQSIGSGKGVQAFIDGTAQLAASDAVLKADEEAAARTKGGEVVHIPWSAGGIALEYHLAGVKNLKLTPDEVAGIWAGTITKWNDSKLTADNPGLPDKPIQVVSREDGSGTSKAFTAYMAAVAPTIWTKGSDKQPAWPVGQKATGSDGVTGLVKQNDGSITYSEVSYAKGAGLDIAKVKNASGAFVEPTPDAVSAAIASATVPADLKVAVDYKAANPAAYPISTVTWAISFVHPRDPAVGQLIRDFILYAAGPGQNAAAGLDYAPLPAELAAKAKAAALTIGA
ncbi:MAG: phosphate transport system substrate-binding protein [Actinomycetota bacterium]|jgi:phosphate transport system substrate-binding protein|nr:phosphate transport system substrate-binding protein [Actinomycetota bacterium]